MQFVKNALGYVFGVSNFCFCYCFYEGFIHKIILVSQFLPFICISYLLKVFKFDTGILRDSCAVPLLKTLSRLPQSIAFLCLILFLMFACNNFPFRAFVTMIYWTSREVLLNFVGPLDSAVPSLDFDQINIFLTSGFDFVSIVFGSLSVSRSVPELYFAFDLGVSSLDLERINMWFMALTPLALHSFPL